MRIGIYTTRELLESGSGDTRYLHDALRRRFPVSVYLEPDPTRCAKDAVVLVRYTRPLRRRFLMSLGASPDRLVINEPAAQLRYGSKRNLLEFPDLTPPTTITRCPDELRRFAREHGSIVLKPLDRHVGAGVTRIGPDRVEAADWPRRVAEFLRRYGTPVAQRYLPCVEESGDKRINVFGYEAISAIRTVPAKGSFLAHRSLGGSERPAAVMEEDQRILARVVPFLRKHGIWWAGLDVIGSHLTELNIVTPSMVRRADEMQGSSRGLDAIVDRLESHATTLAA